MRLIEDDDAVEVAPQPVDDLSDPGALALALGRAQRGIGGEEDGIAQLNGGTLPVMRERDDVALGATEGGPVAHRVLDQLVGLGDPERPAPALERSEEHTSELQSLMRISYAVFCLKKKTQKLTTNHTEVSANRHTNNQM